MTSIMQLDGPMATQRMSRSGITVGMGCIGCEQRTGYARRCWWTMLGCAKKDGEWLQVMTASKARVTSIQGWLLDLLQHTSDMQISVVVTVLWGLWRELNDQIWQGKSKVEELIVRLGREQIQEWKSAKARGRVQGQPRRAIILATSDVKEVPPK
ncbi:hypothetical protein LINGRAHAP2_LOCUS22976 [Linum grandiflorum]